VQFGTANTSLQKMRTRAKNSPYPTKTVTPLDHRGPRNLTAHHLCRLVQLRTKDKTDNSSICACDNKVQLRWWQIQQDHLGNNRYCITMWINQTDI